MGSVSCPAVISVFSNYSKGTAWFKWCICAKVKNVMQIHLNTHLNNDLLEKMNHFNNIPKKTSGIITINRKTWVCEFWPFEINIRIHNFLDLIVKTMINEQNCLHQIIQKDNHVCTIDHYFFLLISISPKFSIKRLSLFTYSTSPEAPALHTNPTVVSHTVIKTWPTVLV